MAHYIMSDIHGEAGRFHAMLEKVSFSQEGTLYILSEVDLNELRGFFDTKIRLSSVTSIMLPSGVSKMKIPQTSIFLGKSRRLLLLHLKHIGKLTHRHLIPN